MSEQAMEIFKQPKSGRRRSRSPVVIAELGSVPDRSGPIRIRSGRYGPYVTDGTVNATVPKGREPTSVTLEEAVQLLIAREQKARENGEPTRAKGKTSNRGGSRRKPARSSTP